MIKHRKHKKKEASLVLTTIGSALLLGVGIAIYIVVRMVMHDTNTAAVNTWKPTGSIYLTLTPLQGSGMGIHQFNTVANTLTPYYAPLDRYALTGTFVGADASIFLTSEFVPNDTFQIAKISKGVSAPLTDSSVAMKRHPSWSVPLQSLFYSGKEKNAGTLGNPNEFSVYRKAADGIERAIGSGAMPALTPDGKSLVVLQNDGLALIHVDKGTTERIWPLESGTSSLNQQFALSPKGGYLAWTDPERGVINIMQVYTLSPFMGQIKYRINTHAFWPIFSPDEKYIAFEEVEWTTPPSKPHLVIMNLVTLERRSVLDLGLYGQERMFMSTWK